MSLELDMYVVQAGLKLSDLPASAFQVWGSLGFTTQHTLVSYTIFLKQKQLVFSCWAVKSSPWKVNKIKAKPPNYKQIKSRVIRS